MAAGGAEPPAAACSAGRPRRDGRRWVLPLAARHPDVVGRGAALLLSPPRPGSAGRLHPRVLPAGCLGARSAAGRAGRCRVLVRTAACDALGMLGDPRSRGGARRVAWPAHDARRARGGGGRAGAAARRGAARAPADAAARGAGRGCCRPARSRCWPSSRWSRSPRTGAQLTACRARAAAPRRRSAPWPGYPGTRAEVLLLRALADRDPRRPGRGAGSAGRPAGGDRVATTLLALLGVADSLRYHVIRAAGPARRRRGGGAARNALPRRPAARTDRDPRRAGRRSRSDASRAFLLACLEPSGTRDPPGAARGLAELARPEDLELFLLAGGGPRLGAPQRGRARRSGRIRRPEGRETLLESGARPRAGRGAHRPRRARRRRMNTGDRSRLEAAHRLLAERFGLSSPGPGRRFSQAGSAPGCRPCTSTASASTTTISGPTPRGTRSSRASSPATHQQRDLLLPRTGPASTPSWTTSCPSLRSCAPDRPLRMLSAGCSSGEEAYSLAVRLTDSGIELTGARLDDRCLRPQSRSGWTRRGGPVYEGLSFRACDEAMLRHCFTKVDGRDVPLRDRYRSDVRFFPANLAATDRRPRLGQLRRHRSAATC